MRIGLESADVGRSRLAVPTFGSELQTLDLRSAVESSQGDVKGV